MLDEGWLGDIVDAEMHFDRYVPLLSYKVHKETPTAAVGVARPGVTFDRSVFGFIGIPMRYMPILPRIDLIQR